MRALTHTPKALDGLAFADVPEPLPGPAQAVVTVRASSINFGELTFMASRRPTGHVPGNDAAGEVAQAAADGSGPPAGTRVLAFAGVGAWAERVAVATDQLAIVPESVDLATAAALPTAATTALRALRGLGPVLGRRVLITGASGGVGRFAVQLAARAGAHVVAAVGRPERGAGLVELGAAEVVVGLAGVAPVHGVLDTVGGPLLGEAFGVGSHPFGDDLAMLVGLLAAGDLDPQIGWRGSWEDVHEAVVELQERRLHGKAVLEVSS